MENFNCSSTNNSIQWLLKKNLAVIMAIIAIFLAQITEKTGASGPMMVGYILILFGALASRANTIFYLILFLLSDNSIFDIGGISIQLLLMAIFFMKFVLMRERKICESTFVLSILLAVYSIIHMSQGINAVLQGLKLALMMIYFVEYFRSEETLTIKNYSNALKFAIWGLIISIAAAIIVNPSLLLSERIALSEDSNWNLLGILAALLFSHSLVMYFNRSGNEYLFYSAVMVLVAIITASRTAFLTIALSVVWVALVRNKGLRDLYKRVAFIILVLFGVFLIISGNIHISFADQLIDRIINPRQDDISNGRFILWEQYIYVLRHDMNLFIFGQGTPLIEGISMINETKSLVAHSMYIEQMVMYGLVGNIIVATLYYKTIGAIYITFKSRGLYKPNYRYCLNIVLIFAIGIFSHLLTSVLVTTELFIGIMQFYVLSNYNQKTR
jgi:hypothetical protein